MKKESGKLTIDCSSAATSDIDMAVEKVIHHFGQAVEGLKRVKGISGLV